MVSDKDVRSMPKNDVRFFSKKAKASGIRFSFVRDGQEIARARLYVLKNDLHKEPFGFMEDVYVDESARNEGWGKKIVQSVIDRVKKEGCYKLVATSRSERGSVHTLYEKLNFQEKGKEFRIDF